MLNINHKNGAPRDNDFSNLEIVTSKVGSAPNDPPQRGHLTAEALNHLGATDAE